SGATDLSRAEVAGDVAHLEPVRTGLVGAAQLRSPRGGDRFEGEWLHDVVVRALVEALDLVRDLAARGQKDHGHVAPPLADRRQNGETALLREQYVEQHQRVIPVERLDLRSGAVVHAGDRVTLRT